MASHKLSGCAAQICPFSRALLRPVQRAMNQTQFRHFTKATPILHGDPIPEPLNSSTSNPSASDTISRMMDPLSTPSPQPTGARYPSHTPRYALARAPRAPDSIPSTPSPDHLEPEFLAQLVLLAGQGPHYITIHIHGKPYLVTAGDQVRLPFLMHGVMPGDVLRLDRASIIGSREWTLRAGARGASRLQSAQDQTLTPSPVAAEIGQAIIGRTTDLQALEAQVEPLVDTSSPLRPSRPKTQNKLGYLDPALFICRATVLGTESEPLRVKEKTKRRQRHIRRVTSKHRYTILRISEVNIRVPGVDFE